MNRPNWRDIVERIDLRRLCEEAGAKFNTSLRSVCPLHPGADNPHAFGLWPRERPHSWRCFTGCPEGQDRGNAIHFYMRWKNVDFATALLELAARVNLPGTVTPASPQPALPARLAPAPALPPALYRERLAAFIAYCQEQLWQPRNAYVLAYLRQASGWSDETIRAWGLGYHPTCRWRSPASWGLAGNKKIYLSKGIVYPYRRQGEYQWANIRRPRPGDELAGVIGPVTTLPEVKYCGLAGGSRGLYGLDYLTGQPALFLVEGERDCLTAWQAIHDLADVATLGGARGKLTVTDAIALTRYAAIIALYDNDAAGDEGRSYLRQVSQRVKVSQTPAHDLTEYWRQGGDVRVWLKAQLATVRPDARPTVAWPKTIIWPAGSKVAAPGEQWRRLADGRLEIIYHSREELALCLQFAPWEREQASADQLTLLPEEAAYYYQKGG